MIEFNIKTNNNKLIKEIIDKTMIRYDYIYKINTNSNKEINNNNYKIYIIDYDINKYQTIKLLNKIRYIENDWQSMIIILSNNYMNIVDKLKDYMIIQISDNNKNEIKKGIIKSIYNYDQHPNTIKYNYKSILYNINLKDILYIEKEKETKICTIHTSNNRFPILISLNNIMNLLDKRFIKCSRSYIINMEQVLYYDKKRNIISFVNEKQINEISRLKKQEIIKYLRNVE